MKNEPSKDAITFAALTHYQHPTDTAQLRQSIESFAKFYGVSLKKRKPTGDLLGAITQFVGNESGSLAAYQQRVRGAQQFDKVEVKQLDVQMKMEGHLANLAKNMPIISGMGA